MAVTKELLNCNGRMSKWIIKAWQASNEEMGSDKLIKTIECETEDEEFVDVLEEHHAPSLRVK